MKIVQHAVKYFSLFNIFSERMKDELYQKRILAILNKGYRILDTGYLYQDTEQIIQDTGQSTQDKGYSGIQDAGCWNQDTGYRILDTITD